MCFGLRVGQAGEDGIDDWLLPFFDGLGECFQLGDVDVVGAPGVEGGEAVADGAGRGGAAGFRGAEREDVPELLFRDPDGGDMLPVRVGVEGVDDDGEVVRGQVLEVAPEHVVQRPWQAEFLVVVLGAVAQAAECRADLLRGLD